MLYKLSKTFSFIILLNVMGITQASDHVLKQNNESELQYMFSLTTRMLGEVTHYCQQQQPQSALVLEQAYISVKSEYEKMLQSIEFDGNKLVDLEEWKSPLVGEKTKMEMQGLLNNMLHEIKKVDSKQYCPYFLEQMQNFDMETLKQQTQYQYLQLQKKAKK